MEDEEVLDQISLRLQEDGLPPDASPKERQCHLWKQLLTTEATLLSSTQELHSVRTQQANELKEVDNYVEHIRGLLQQRECLTAGYERENEELRHELHILRQQQDIQSKELAELLAQEDLSDMGLSSPSEQVAYLLVERTTLLERLEAAERNPNSNTRDVQAHSEEISNERLERQRLERDLEEASNRLAMAHQDIRRLTGELDVAKSNNLNQNGLELQGTVEEVEFLRKEVDKLKHCDMVKLQKAREESERLENENKSLRGKVFTLEAENNNLLFQLERNDAVTDNQPDDTASQQSQTIVPAKEKDLTHKRCQAAMEDRLVQVKELERQIQRLRKELEELGERNEELEALLGETQNASKEERHRHEGELEGLHRKIKNLEGELKKQEAGEKVLRNGEESKTTESYFQMHMSSSSQERLALLEARLTEEKEWRKQLELDLGAAQAALKKDKEALHIGERELKKLRLEVNSLQTECQQGKTLIKSLNQVKGEKGVLEEKVAQMERAHQRLQSELDRYSKQVPQQNAFHVDQLQQTNQRLTEELSDLQSAHATLRDEMAAERRGAEELQAEVSNSVQKKLVAEGERERLQLEIQRLSEELQRRQQHPASVDQVSVGPQHQLALQALVSEAQAHIKSQDLVLSQKAEEAKQMKQDLQRAQNLFTSAERELRYEKEKNTDLKKHNTLLEQEKLKLSAELHHAQTKLAQVEQSVQVCTEDCERHQQRVRELELELARSSANRSNTSSLQEELQAERHRVITADKKVLELQQQLKNTQHQLRMEEARAGENCRLERDSRDLSDALSALRAHQQEDHITRKLLEQREEELQQQVRSLRLKEATLTRTNAELVHRVKQLDTRLTVLEAELNKSREEARESQTSCQRVTEELAASQQACERVQEELQQLLLQLDAHVRKYNEKQSQHKTKMRQAKQVFIRATSQRDGTIQKLENKLSLANSLSLKEKERILQVLEENEKLLEEKRELLLKISEAEDMGSNGMRAASTVQHRVNVLEVENRQLQDRTVKLSNQVSSLERALRNAQSLHNMENVKRGLSTEAFCDGMLQSSTFSMSSSSYETLDILDAICRVKVDRTPDGSRLSSHTLSEQGYLNLASPLVPPDVKDTKEAPDDGAKV